MTRQKIYLRHYAKLWWFIEGENCIPNYSFSYVVPRCYIIVVAEATLSWRMYFFRYMAFQINWNPTRQMGKLSVRYRAALLRQLKCLAPSSKLRFFPIFKLFFWIDHWMASSASQKVWPISNVRKKERKQKRLLWWRVSNWFFTHGNLKGSVSGYTWHLRLSSLPVCYWGPFRKEKVWTSIEDWAPEPHKINTTHCISFLLRKSTK